MSNLTISALRLSPHVRSYVRTKCVRSLSRINTGICGLCISARAKTGLRSLSRINTGVKERTPPTLKGVPPRAEIRTGVLVIPPSGSRNETV
jgi:hypothetical protein